MIKSRKTVGVLEGKRSTKPSHLQRTRNCAKEHYALMLVIVPVCVSVEETTSQYVDVLTSGDISLGAGKTS